MSSAFFASLADLTLTVETNFAVIGTNESFISHLIIFFMQQANLIRRVLASNYQYRLFTESKDGT
jgi:hypothetical protein